MGSIEKRFPIYGRLLKLFPGPYYQRYHKEILQTLADMLDDPDRPRATTWLRTAIDFPFSVIYQQVIYLGGAMATSMPNYVKRNALIGAWFIAPFFVFVISNSLTSQRLYHSILWRRNILFIWLILLPTLAILFNLASLLRWVNARRRTTHASTWQILIDYKNSWPALGVIVVGLGILALVFGHDSVQCVAGNPFHEAANWHKTLQCIQNPPQGPRQQKSTN